MWKRRFRDAHTNRPGRRRPSRRIRLVDLAGLESLDRRLLPAVSVTFSPAQGILTVLGDALDNSIAVTRDASGKISVAGAVVTSTIKPTVSNTNLIQVFGLGGNDNLSLDESRGPLPAAKMFGGDGNDTINGGHGNDQLFGEAGNDTLRGMGGGDLVFGGAGDDVLIGGTGSDQVFGQAGNDRLIWNEGDGSDLDESGDGIDTVEVDGNDGAEAFAIAANGTRVRLDRTGANPATLDIGSSENLVVDAKGGKDTITAGNGLAPLISITMVGGAGNDTLLGGDGNDTLLGGDGNDFIEGNRGNDVALLGAGDDTFTWNPGDASDTVEGQAGSDMLLFNGSNAGENFNVSANGSRVRFTRDVGAVTMDLNGIEGLDLNALGGADTVTVNDLTGTGLTQLNLDLSSPAGSGTGDGLADSVIVNGTNGADAITAVGNSSGVSVNGLSTRVNITGAEPSRDRLTINTLGGDDVLQASGLTAGAILLTANGGTGNDLLIGGHGNDTMNGGEGDDILIGGPGADILDGGTGSNILIQD